MNESLKKILDQMKNIWTNAGVTQRIIAGVVLLGAIALVIGTFMFTSQKPGSLLFSKALDNEEAKLVLGVLDKSGIAYEYRKGLITLSDERAKAQAELELTKADAMPNRAHVYEGIFDGKGKIGGFTKEEYKVKSKIALEKAITEKIELYDFVQTAHVTVTFPEKEFLTEAVAPVTASVIVTPAPYSDDAFEDSKIIKGMRRIIARGVDKLDEENVEISDNTGRLLTDFEDETDDRKIALSKAQLKIVKHEANSLKGSVEALIKANYPGRHRVTADVEFVWDEITMTNDEVIPIEVIKDNPLTPYSEQSNIVSVDISKQVVEEEWRGQQFIPEGAAGAEEQIPAGYKDKTDRWQTYNKDQTIENKVVSKQLTTTKKNNYDIARKTVSVILDGYWTIERDKNGEPLVTNGGYNYVRSYTPVSEEEVRKVEEIVKRAIGYKQLRGDEVIVQHIPFDRRAEFQKEDEALQQKMKFQRILMVSLISLLTVLVLALVIRAVQKEIARRRRRAEEERERRQSELRQQAMLQAQEEPTSEMSIEEAARRRLYDEVSSLARERPEDVAALLRTWIVDEGASG